jgi:hypothetical protein
MVPLADGTPPPNWPIGFDRAMLRTGPIAVVISLLTDYGLVPPAAALDRRNLRALHIGTADRVVVARLLGLLAKKLVAVHGGALAAGSSLRSEIVAPTLQVARQL